jgi:hypothetical protein
MKVGDRFNPWKMFHGAFIPNWLLCRKEVNASAKLVYARLCQFGGEDGEVYPSIEKIVDETGVSERGVRYALKELQDLNLIAVDLRRTQGSSSQYFFLVHEWMVAAFRGDPPEEPPAKSAGDPRQKVPGTPGKKCRSPPAKTAGLKFNPSEETPGKDSQGRSRAALAPDTHSETPDGAGGAPAEAAGETNHADEQKVGACATAEPGADDGSVVLGDGTVFRLDRARKSAVAAMQKTNGARDEKAARQQRLQQAKAERRKQEQESGIETVEREGSPVTRLEKTWFEQFALSFPGVPVARKWSLKQRGQVKQVLDLYDADRVDDAIVYLIRNWKAIRAKVWKNKGDATPGVGVLQFLHDSLVPNAAIWAKHQATLDEYEQYAPGDPDAERPSELQTRYVEAVNELKALGLEVGGVS